MYVEKLENIFNWNCSVLIVLCMELLSGAYAMYTLFCNGIVALPQLLEICIRQHKC